jgi:tRNA(adenine34) deaminase
MKAALEEAEKALALGEVPVGAVFVKGEKIIARGHNSSIALHDASAHAEMIAITSAASYLGTKWLNQASLYVTIEPCSMCAGALVLARIKNLYFGASDPKTGGQRATKRHKKHKKKRLDMR